MRTQAEIKQHRDAVLKSFPAGRKSKTQGPQPGAPKSAAEVKAELSTIAPEHVAEAIKFHIAEGNLASSGKGPATRYFRPAKISTAA